MQARSGAVRRPSLESADFNRQPFVLAWELTRACNLACVHCRAAAQLRRHPDELSTSEAFAVIEEIARFDPPPVLIFTGGDPMRRPDLVQLVELATRLGIICTLTPAGTPLAGKRRLAELQAAGLSRVAVSIDGPDAASHDTFRRSPGSFGWTLALAAAVQELGLPLQVHSTLSRQTAGHMPALADLADQLGAVVWAVFCLVPTGRGQFEDALPPDELEAQFQWLSARSRTAGWNLKLTEGYHFRRVLAQQHDGAPVQGLGFRAADGIHRAPQAVNAGNGFCFISHVGDINPSGFLPLYAGNVRQHSLVEVYRKHQIFRELRDPQLLGGKCGRCPYRALCGGSRSRAFAYYGDYLAEDPACAYQPA